MSDRKPGKVATTPKKPRAKKKPDAELGGELLRKRARPRAIAQRLLATKGRLAWLREGQRQAVEMYAEARHAGSYVAAEKCLHSAADMGTEIEALEKAEAAGQGALSEEGFLTRFDESLDTLPEPYLERAVACYLSRHPGMRLLPASDIE